MIWSQNAVQIALQYTVHSSDIQLMQSSLFKSLVSNWFGHALAVLIGFFISPFVVHKLGQENYGYWVFILSITSQFVLLDLGLGYCMTRRAAILNKKNDSIALSITLSNSIFISLVAALICALIVYALAPFFPDFIETNPELLRILQLTLIISGLDVALEIVAAPISGNLAGAERYDLINLSNVLRLGSNALILVLVLSQGYGILGLALTTFGVKLCQKILLVYLNFSTHKELQLRPSFIQKNICSGLIKEGLIISSVVASARIVGQVDALVVGTFLGAKAVSIYAIALLLTEQIKTFLQMGANIFLPRFSALHAENNASDILTLLLKWVSYSQIIVLSIGAPLLITGSDFIRLWMGELFSTSALVMHLLVLPAFFVAPASIFVTYLYATYKVPIYVRILGIEALLNLLLSVILVKYMGLFGVAIGTIIPSITISAIYLPFKVCKICEIPFENYIRHAFVKTLPLFVLQFASLLSINHFIGARTWPLFILNNSLGLLIFLLCATYLLVSREDRLYCLRRLGLR